MKDNISLYIIGQSKGVLISLEIIFYPAFSVFVFLIRPLIDILKKNGLNIYMYVNKYVMT